MKLKVGQKAPDFAVSDIAGQLIDLDDYRGKKVLLCFLRYAGCPQCNLLLHNLIQRYPKYHAEGLEVIAFVQSTRESIEEYPMKRQQPAPPFPLIADPDRVIYDQYGVEVSTVRGVKGFIKAGKNLSRLKELHLPQGKIDGKIFLMPAFFLLQPNQKIHRAYYTADFSSGVPDIDIQDFLLFE